tara:strand:+ start:295 stop:1470 length:1176 start_codon:yes stop_codon:yes gene_type:complete
MSFAKINLHELSRIHRSKKKSYLPKEDIMDDELSCIYCNEKTLIPYDGSFLCKTCNYYQSKHIDAGQEWRDYDNSDGNSQCRSSMTGNDGLLSDNNVGTKIGYSQKGNNMNSNYLRTRHNWTTSNYKDDNLMKRFKTITNICRKVNINGNIIEESKIVFKKISEVKSARRSKLQALMATAVIIGHRICGLEKSFSEIAGLFDLDIKVLRKMVKEYEFIWEAIQTKEGEEIEKLRQLSRNESKNDNNNNNINNLEPKVPNLPTTELDNISSQVDIVYDKDSNINSENMKIVKNDITIEDNKVLKSFMISLQISRQYYVKAYLINNFINDKKILNQHIPKSRYAAIINFMSNIYDLKLKKGNICKKCEITNITMNKCYQKILPFKDELITLIT